MKDNSVANHIMNTIRGTLPISISDELRQSYSGKSARQSSTTTLVMANGLDYTDVCGRTGHNSGTTIDTYQDKECIATGMRGGTVLAGWKPDADVKVPKLDKLPNDSIYRLISKLFIISEPMKAFRKEGDLHMVLCTCTASLIMYYNDVVKDFGESNAVASKLRWAAGEAKETQIRSSNIHCTKDIIMMTMNTTMTIRQMTMTSLCMIWQYGVLVLDCRCRIVSDSIFNI